MIISALEADNFINIGYVGSPLYKVGDIVQISSIKRELMFP